MVSRNFLTSFKQSSTHYVSGVARLFLSLDALQLCHACRMYCVKLSLQQGAEPCAD